MPSLRRTPFTYDYERPAVTVDVVVYTLLDGEPHVLLIQRAAKPYARRWALPGGFVEPMENLEKAARRELKEETGIEVGTLIPIGAYGDRGRDPRGWTVSAAYLAVVGPNQVEPAGADDASQARWHRTRRLPPLAFDHLDILRAASKTLRREIYRRPLFAKLLPRRFTWQELHTVYEAFDPDAIDPAVLKRRLRAFDCVEPGRKPRTWHFRRAGGAAT